MGVVAGAFTRSIPKAILAIVVLEVVAAPLMYYAPPLSGRGSMVEYQAWALIAIPMLGAHSAIWSFVIAVAILLIRRRLPKRRERI